MSPSPATRPDAVIAPLADPTWPLLIPIWTVAPLVQAVFLEAIRTFHSPSNVAAAAGVAASVPSSHRMRMEKMILRERLTAVPFVPTQSTSPVVCSRTVIEITPERQGLGLSSSGANVGEKLLRPCWFLGHAGEFHEASFSGDHLRCSADGEHRCLCRRCGVRQGNGRALLTGRAVRRHR